MGRDVGRVEVAGLDNEAQQAVQHRDVGAQPGGQVHGGPLGGVGQARVDDDELGWVGARQPVQDAHPEDRLLGGDVVAHVQDGLSGVEVGIGARLPIRAKGNLERGGRCGRAQARASVHVRRAKASLAHDGQGIIFFQHQLTGSVKANRAAGMLLNQLLRLAHNQVHRLVPGSFFQLAVAANKRLGEAVLAAIRFPAVQALGAQPAMVDAVDAPAAHAHHAAVFHTYIHAAAVGAEHASRLHPAVGGLDGALVYAFRPVAFMAGAGPPNVLDAVAGFFHGRVR